MNIDLLTQSLQTLLAPVMGALGISDVWFLTALFFVLLCVVFLILLIAVGAGRAKMRRDLIELSDYIRELEGMMNFQPITIPDQPQAMPTQPGRPIVAPMPAPSQNISTERTERIPIAPIGSNSADETQNLTAAIHDAIYASVTGSHSAIDSEPQDPIEQNQDDGDHHRNELSDRIPHI